MLINKDIEKISIDGFNCEISDHGLTYLSNKLIENEHPKLKSLSFSYTKIIEEGLIALSDYIIFNTSLIDLSIYRKIIWFKLDDGLGDEGVKHLSKGLEKNSTLKSMSFYGNFIGNLGLKYLSDSLKTNKGLEILSLNQNYYDGNGIVEFSNCFSINNTLKKIDLSFRNKTVTSDQFKIFFENLGFSRSIKSLKLYGTF
jgi:hypothetical protein